MFIGFRAVEGGLASNKQLQTVQLDGNQLTDVSILAAHPSLIALSASRNEITAFAPAEGSAPGMEVLDLSWNAIASTDGIERVSALRVLNFRG